MTDYGVSLMTRLAEVPPDGSATVRDLSEASGIPMPTVSKVLKQLTRAALVTSLRGAHGGYRLARPAAQMHVAEVIEALEGPIGVTDCAVDEDGSNCEYEGRCDVQGNWQRVNTAVYDALAAISLEEMAVTKPPQLIRLARSSEEAARLREQASAQRSR